MAQKRSNFGLGYGFGGLSVYIDKADLRDLRAIVIAAMEARGFDRRRWSDVDEFQALEDGLPSEKRWRYADYVLVRSIPEARGWAAVEPENWLYTPGEFPLAQYVSETYRVAYVGSIGDQNEVGLYEEGELVAWSTSESSRDRTADVPPVDWDFFTDRGAYGTALELEGVFRDDIFQFGALTGCEGRSLAFAMEGTLGVESFSDDELLVFTR